MDFINMLNNSKNNKVRTVKKYDEKGKLFSKLKYVYDNDDGRLIKKIVTIYKFFLIMKSHADFEYDEQNKFIIKSYVKSRFLWIINKVYGEYFYNENGLLIKHIDKNPKAPYADMLCEYKYDDGLLKEVHTYLNNVLFSKTIYEYDNDKIVKGIMYNKDNEQFRYNIYEYDNDDTLINFNMYYNDGRLKEHTVIEYFNN